MNVVICVQPSKLDLSSFNYDPQGKKESAVINTSGLDLLSFKPLYHVKGAGIFKDN